MTRRKKMGIALLLAVILAALLAGAYYPRSFAQVMGQDYDPNRLDNISVSLSHPDADQSREVTLSPTDPAAGQLLALLEGQRYRPVYHNPWGAISGRSLAMDYWIHGFIVVQVEDGYSGLFFAFDGNPEVTIGDGGFFRRGFRLDPAVQRQVLDLLLEQPYTTGEETVQETGDLPLEIVP